MNCFSVFFSGIKQEDRVFDLEERTPDRERKPKNVRGKLSMAKKLQAFWSKVKGKHYIIKSFVNSYELSGHILVN